MTIPLKKALNLSIGAGNLKRLCWLRVILLTFEATAFLLANCHFQLSLTGLFIALLFNIMLISSTAIRLAMNEKNVSDREFFFQLLLDLFSQTILLFFSGGYTNPLVSIYLITVCIGAALLPRHYSWSLTFSAILLYTLLMKWYLPTGIELAPEQPLLHQLMINIHLLGMGITFVLSALLINYFVELMASALKKQQKAIASTRERQLRDENILAIAIQAAGTAHELGTPLATMAIVLQDLQDEYDDKALTHSLKLLRSQVDECKKRLQQLVVESQYKGIEPIDSRDFLFRVIEKWQLIRPESALNYQSSQWPDAVFIPCDLTLYQAITALLDNAEDASPGQVSLSIKQNNKTVAIQIRDHGMGFSDKPPAEPCTQKESSSGLGLGLLLSQAGIERLGGQVQIFSQPVGGTLTEILLPMVSNGNQEQIAQ